MRKPPRLPAEQLAPYTWVPPGEAAQVRWGAGPPTDAPAPPPEFLVWSELFGNHHPVEIEIGFGKGLFLLNSAAAHPEKNYFGVEIIRKYQLLAATRLASRNLTNVRTCCADANRILQNHVPPKSVAAVHIYFPDPWWKARHKKRTLVTPEFAKIVAQVLAPNSILHFATDVPDYAQMATDIFQATPTLTPMPPPPEFLPTHDMDYLTNFERRFRKQGKPIHRMRYQKGG